MTPQQAMQQMDENLQRIVELENEANRLRSDNARLVRIVNGDNLLDEHNEKAEREYREKMQSWDNGTHPWLQAQQADREEAELSRQRDQERAARERQRAEDKLEQIARFSPR